MRIYFAASIRGGREDWASYLEIVKQLQTFGSVLTEHVGDAELSVAGEDIDDQTIYARDIEWLREADCLVAEVTTPSLGVGYEIGKATEWGKPVLCLYRPSADRKLSGMIAGCGGVLVHEYQSTQELPPVLRQFFEVNKKGASTNQTQ